MKFAHLADLHITEKSNGHTDTLDEQVDRLCWIGDDAIDRDASAILVAGDIFDHASTIAERNAAIDVVRYWARHMQVVILRGNHDRPGDLHFLGQLRSGQYITVAEHPCQVYIHAEDHTTKIACLPWPNKSGIVSSCAEMSLDAIDATTDAAMDAVMSWLRIQQPDVLLAHVEIGAALGHNAQSVIGRSDFPMSTDDIHEVGAKYAALGHIHSRMDWVGHTGDIDHPLVARYAGSPRHTEFSGEIDPGYTFVDLCGPTKYVHVPTPGRQLLAIDGVNNYIYDDTVTSDNAIKGNAIKVKYCARSDEREQVYEEAYRMRDHLLETGAHSVEIEVKIEVTERVRCDRISTQLTTYGQVDACWDSSTRPARHMQILDKLYALITEEGGNEIG